MAKDVVVNGANIKCTGGSHTSFLKVPPNLKIKVDGSNVANVDHHKSIVNVLPFGTCKLQNGKPPCVPDTPSPWSGGEGTVPLGGQPVLNVQSRLKCTHGGKITFVSSGQGTPFFAVDNDASPQAVAFAKWREARLRYVEALKAQFAAENEAEHLSTLDMLRNTMVETAKEASGYNDLGRAIDAARRGDLLSAAGSLALAAPTPFGKVAKGVKGVRATSKALRGGRRGAAKGGREAAKGGGKAATRGAPANRRHLRNRSPKRVAQNTVARTKRVAPAPPRNAARCPLAPRAAPPPKTGRGAPPKKPPTKPPVRRTPDPDRFNSRPPIPRKHGEWDGPPGNSGWKSTRPDVNDVTGGKPVPYRNDYPDYSEWSRGTVQIKMKGNRTTDFDDADELFAKEQGWLRPDGTPDVVRAERYRKSNRLTWHHVEDCKTMMLVPTALNDLSHRGGVSVIKNNACP